MAWPPCEKTGSPPKCFFWKFYSMLKSPWWFLTHPTIYEDVQYMCIHINYKYIHNTYTYTTYIYIYIYQCKVCLSLTNIKARLIVGHQGRKPRAQRRRWFRSSAWGAGPWWLQGSFFWYLAIGNAYGWIFGLFRGTGGHSNEIRICRPN